MKKPAIPKAQTKFEQAIKERLEIISGERTEKIKALAPSASLPDVISKINEIIEAIQ